MAADKLSTGTLNRKDIASYLDYHLLGSAAGVALFDAVRQAWAGTPQEAEFRKLRQEVAAERKELKALHRGFGHGRNKLKRLGAMGGAVISRVNPLNPTRASGGVGTQLELESLLSALRGKQCMWQVLAALAPMDPRLDALRFQELEAQAVAQQKRVERMMNSTAAQRFLADQS
ncbi:MAG: hypothetical protein ACQEXN_05865 [Actinomycetota bacterium]